MFNIPLPGNMIDTLMAGVKTGSGAYANAMHPILEREKQKQLEAHFQEQLKLSKATAGRAAQAAADAHRIALNNLDPTHKAKEYEALENYFKSKGNSSGQQGAQALSALPMPEQALGMPQQEEGQGLGMFSPEGMQGAQQDAQQAQQQMQQQQAQQQSGQQPNNYGIDLELMKQHPMLRGWYKHNFGVDPLAAVPQTPEEKMASQLDLFKKKEEYKANSEQKLPAAIKTLHENIIHLSPKAVDAIQKIIDKPSPLEPWGFGAIKSGQKAAHNKAVTAAAENYSKAKGWPNTKGSIEKAESILQRGKFETDFDYRTRLKEYQDELKEGMQTSNQFLHPNKQLETPKSNDHVVEYIRVNGKLVPK